MFQIVVLTNDLLPGDISMEDFALAFAGKGGWCSVSSNYDNVGTIHYYEACTHVVSLYKCHLSALLFL